MKSYIYIYYDGITHVFLLYPSPYQNINVSGAVHFRIYKHHSHRYELTCFFYDARRIVGTLEFKTKKKLLHVIQNLLEQYLYVHDISDSG